MLPEDFSWAKVKRKLSNEISGWRRNLQVWRLIRRVGPHTPLWKNFNAQRSADPVAFFNASTRITGISLNAGFSLIASLGLQLAGVPVVHFACQAGMSQCMLGTNRDDLFAKPPCKACIGQSRWLFAGAPTITFSFQQSNDLDLQLQDLDIEHLCTFTAPFRRNANVDIPLGALVLPGVRWVLRRHHLADDAATRHLFRAYIQSAYHIVHEFDNFVEQLQPKSVVVFNGQSYPEATVRWTAKRHAIQVITHEVGLRPFTAFFTAGQATEYPIFIPDDFVLSDSQNARLDAYLSERFKGDFSMAGIRFWPEMHELDETILHKLHQFRQVVPVFTNVVFDTSQSHANTIFPHMFAWLDVIAELIPGHPDTLFVFRAHPDELRSGKASRETVAQWVQQKGIQTRANALFINPDEYVNSYELIQRSKFVMVYNSSIGLEAALMGVSVLSGGRARYTRYPIVYFPADVQEFRMKAEEMLNAGEISVPVEFKLNARRFLYYQLFRASLPFENYLEEHGPWPGFVRLKQFDWSDLLPKNSPTIEAIINGVLHQGDFLLPEN